MHCVGVGWLTIAGTLGEVGGGDVEAAGGCIQKNEVVVKNPS